MRPILALLAIAATAVAQPSPAPSGAPVPAVKDLKFPALKPIPVPKVESFTLSNGMRLLLLEDHELPLIGGTARVRTGNLFDPKDQVGLATMTGMVMRTGGTKTKTGEQLDQALEDVAASVESSIGESSGSVSFSALKDNSAEVMGIFKDVLTAPEFRQEKIDLAKTQMHSSIARRNDNPQGILEREFASTVYGKSTPYGWDIEHATVDRITRRDLQEFYGRYFFPKNVILAVWGDFNAAEMRQRLETLFADWKVEQPAVPAFPKVETKPVPGVYLAVKGDVTQTFFSLGHLGGELRDKDYAALEILSDILGGGFQSRLLQRVRTQMGNAYSIGASWSAQYDHPGIFEISGGTKSFSTVETLKAVLEEVTRIRTTEVTQEELTTAKDTALNSLVFAFDTRTKTLSRMLNYEYFGYPRDFIQQYQKALAAVTRADVLRVAKERLKPEEFTIVTVGNPEDFGAQKLDALGLPVHQIDLTIPEAKAEAAEATPASLERGKKLLARAQQAAGGADKLAAVKDYSQVLDYKLTAAAGGLTLKQTNLWIDPAFFRQESLLPNGKIAVFTDGKTGWMVTPQGGGPLNGPMMKQIGDEVFHGYFHLLVSDRIPGWTVNAVSDDTVEIRSAAGQLARLSFDAATGLAQKIRFEAVNLSGPSMPVEQTFSDYRGVNGIQVPFRMDVSQAGVPFGQMTVNEWKLNTGLKAEDLGKRP